MKTKTKIIFESRLEALSLILKFKKFKLSFKEKINFFIVEISPAKAWEIGLTKERK